MKIMTKVLQTHERASQGLSPATAGQSTPALKRPLNPGPSESAAEKMDSRDSCSSTHSRRPRLDRLRFGAESYLRLRTSIRDSSTEFADIALAARKCFCNLPEPYHGPPVAAAAATTTKTNGECLSLAWTSITTHKLARNRDYDTTACNHARRRWGRVWGVERRTYTAGGGGRHRE
ncbi:hypothetical protein BD410DRAFT_570118 [Rickenella mellea]|uniref:Uncharacterized protein n=1 Tax=Rickenella mellea TaxID=50990 RepID=A0A4Y7QH41_9AGAM|nr:hypothetical protein BD410DRAFT_570118 [Rickenella mellea]